jgi:hypothetical protein
LLVIVRLPDELPAEVGENAIVAVVCWLGLMVRGTVAPLILNPGPVMAACVTVSAAVPVFDTMITCETVLPTATDPKLMDEGVRDMAGEPGLRVTPPQPTIMIPNNRAMIDRVGTTKAAALWRDLSGSDSRTGFPFMGCHIVR